MVVGVGFVCLMAIGYSVMNLLASRLPLGERLSLSYGIGLGCVLLLLWILYYGSWVHSPTQLMSIMGALSIAFFIGRYCIKKRGGKVFPVITDGIGGSHYYIGWALMVTLFMVSFLFSYYYPIMMTDGNDYEVTGRLTALTATIEPHHFFRPYPPFIPIVYSFIYFLGGTHPKIIFSFFYLSLVMCFYCRLSALSTRRSASLVFTLILATTPYLWWHSFLGILNFTAAYYFSIATLFWFSHLRNISQSESGIALDYSIPLLAGVFYSLSICTRFEMLAYVFIPLLLTALYSLKHQLLKNVLYLSLPSLCISSYWSFFICTSGVGLGNFKILPVALVVLIVVTVISYVFVFRHARYTVIKLINRCEEQFPLLLRTLGILCVFLIALYFVLPHREPGDSTLSTPFVFFMKTVITKMVTCVVGNVFYLCTSVLTVLLLSKRSIPSAREERVHVYLFVFILLFLIANVAIFSSLLFSSYPEAYSAVDWNYDLKELFRTMLYHPGQLINNTQVRGLLPLYPIVIFFFATSKKVRQLFEV